MEELPIFIHKGTKVIILRGEDFTINELKSRLHKMEVDFNTMKKAKKYFVDLYDSAISYDINKIKIFDKLYQDTNKYNFFETNKRNISLENEETEESPVRNNNKRNQKQFIRSEIGNNNKLNNSKQNNKSDFANIIANQIKKNENNNVLNAFEFDRRRNNNLNQINFEEDMSNRNNETENNFKNRKNIFSNPYKGFNNISEEKNFRKEINLANNFFENYNKNNFDNRNQKYNISSIFPESNTNMNNKINNNQTRGQTNNYNRDYLNIFNPYIQEEQKEDIKSRKYTNLSPNYDRNYGNNNYYQSDISNNKNYKLERKNDFTKFPQEREDRKDYLSLPVNSSNNNSNKNNKHKHSRKELERFNEESFIEEEDEQDNKSDYQNNKNYMDLMLYILLLIIAGFLIYFVLKIIFRVGNTFTQAVTQTVEVVTNPRRLLRDLIFGLIKSILMGIFLEYAYVTLPTAIISFLIIKFKQRREFKKLCQQIIEEIKKDLENAKNKSMSENEIIDKYSKNYNIDKNTFLKKYLKELYKLRKDDHSLKLIQTINEKGENITSWELIH